MFEINNKSLEEKIKQVKKAIEILGGKDLLDNIKSDAKLVELILESAFAEETITIKINNDKFSLKELLTLKLEYEKNYIKNKKKYIEKIIFKIDKYNTYLESLIRKHRKNNSIEIFREIKNEIEIRYGEDIDNFILSSIRFSQVNRKEFYGEYLISKKEDFINSIISKII
jgi:hypothetical protein